MMIQQTVGGMAASPDGLAATAKDCCGRDTDGGDTLLGQGDSSGETVMYRLKVLGTGINKVLEYEANLDTDEVAERWLDGVSEKWNEQMARAFADDIQVRQLCQKDSTSSEESQRAIPMPPIPEEADSQAEGDGTQ